MPICYHENDEIPTRKMMETESAPWVWFMTWHTKWITTDEFNPADRLREVYHAPYFVTLNALPDLIVEGE